MSHIRAPEVGEAGQEGVHRRLDAVGAHLRPGGPNAEGTGMKWEQCAPLYETVRRVPRRNAEGGGHGGWSDFGAMLPTRIPPFISVPEGFD